MRAIDVGSTGPIDVEYTGITAVKIDHDGNLRLYRRRIRVLAKPIPAIFHPAGEWLAFSHRRGDVFVVDLASPETR